MCGRALLRAGPSDDNGRPMTRRRSAALRSLWAAAAITLGIPAWAPAQPRLVRVHYAFQPDCFRDSLAAPCAPRKTDTRLDLGPQIAVWVERADGKQFVDTLMVTNATAFRGIGNRPGHWSLPSSLKFPYGKRPMALPIWAHARGKTYQQLVMQDGMEYWLGFHESISSPDPYYCRPTSLGELDVDAISCPTPVFNAAKGKFAASEPKVYYPPRNDLRMFTPQDCDDRGAAVDSCPTSARQFEALNDLDAVAAATPVYGRPFVGTWVVPGELPDGDYLLVLEISKEFDGNASYVHPAYTDPMLSNSGAKNNFGQPSVIYRVPFRLSRVVASQAAVSEISGYGDWDGATGTIHPPDATLTEGPGAGRGRLLVIAQPAIMGGGEVTGRVHVTTELPAAPALPDAAAMPGASAADAGAGTPVGGDAAPACSSVRAMVAGLEAEVESERALIHFAEPVGAAFASVERYQVRVWEGTETSITAFESGIPAETLAPDGPGSRRTVVVGDLKADRQYTVGVRPDGLCLDRVVAYLGLSTPKRKFSQLSGCFIATAAYGSAQAAGVEALRRVRDEARARSGFAAAAAALYERSSPPVAGVLRETGAGRAAVRAALGPLIGVVEAAAMLR
jgi:hypothetical protein